MKKQLIALAFLPVLASPASAKPAIELETGGFMTFYGTYAKQKKQTEVLTAINIPAAAYDSRPIGKYNEADLMGNAEVYFSGKHEFENGTVLGAMIQLEAGTDSDTSNNVVDETYMTFDSKIGRFIAGNVKNVSNMLAVRSRTVSTIGFQETDFKRMIVIPALFAYNKATYSTLDDISTKLSYISPEIAGFTFAVSAMPGNKTKGKDADNLLIPTDGMKIFKYGFDSVVKYSHDFDGLKMEIGATYSTYKPNLRANDLPEKEKNTNEYGGGILLSSDNWSFGGSYHYVNATEGAGVMAAVTQSMGPHGWVWEIGATYAYGDFSASVNYMHSLADSFIDEGRKDKYDQYQIAGKYKIDTGVEAFADFAYLKYDAVRQDKGLSNKGFAAAVGVNLFF